MHEFFLGATTLAHAIVGLFFLKFWKETNDRLFGLFAAAFLIFALQRAALGLMNTADENSTLLYSIRLVAFIIIIIAIVDKNRSQK